jgi:hypothetical protein
MRHQAILFKSYQEGINVAGLENPDLSQTFSQFRAEIVPMNRTD